MKRAIIYCRVSTDNQEDNTSLETQEEDGRAYCAERGYSMGGVFKDVHSGYDMDRKSLRAALAAIKQGTADVLVVWRLDRLSRKQTHQALLFYQIEEECSARIEAVREEIDRSPVGQFMRAIKGYAAEQERENTKERTIRGKRARAQRGKLIPGSFPPYGYAFADEKRTAFILDDVAAPIVRRMFQTIANGGTLRSLTLSLQAQNTPTPTQHARAMGTLPLGRKVSSHWHPSTVSQILRNPAYKGEPIAYRWRGKGGLRAIDDPTRIPLPTSACPPIIDAATWEIVQHMFIENKAKAARNTRNPEIALLARGYVLCGHCHTPMYTEYHQGKDIAYYVCNRRKSNRAMFSETCEYEPRISTKELDQAVMDDITEMLQHPDAVQKAIEAHYARESEKQGEVKERIDTLEKLIKRDKEKRARLLRAIETLDDPDALTPRINQLNQDIRQYQKERDTLAHAVALPSIPIEKMIEEAIPNLPNKDFAWKRDLMRKLGVTVHVWDKEYAAQYGLNRWGLFFDFEGLNEVVLLQREGSIASTAS